uniref:Uncharacterized protein n=1 Tax=Salvator merianae TaxID=96440 RepID=A0A8D0DWU6_SALMN
MSVASKKNLPVLYFSNSYHKLYITPYIWHCSMQRGIYCHLWWGCEKVASYWSAVQHEIQIMLKVPIIFSPTLCLLHLYQQENSTIHSKKLLNYLLLAAKMQVAQNWKIHATLNIQAWYSLL